MTKITLYLREDEAERLRVAAMRDYRDLANQARFILREALECQELRSSNEIQIA